MIREENRNEIDRREREKRKLLPTKRIKNSSSEMRSEEKEKRIAFCGTRIKKKNGNEIEIKGKKRRLGRESSRERHKRNGGLEKIERMRRDKEGDS